MTNIVKATIVQVTELGRTFSVSRRVGRFRRATHDVRALQGVNLRLDRGEMIGLIGPNGAGKSTLLKIVTGVLTPTTGTVEVCGLDPVRHRRRLTRRLGVVFGQRSQLWWDLPLGMSFDILRRIYEVPGPEFDHRLGECRKFLELDEFIDTPVRQLSLGQRMRGEVAAALLHGPELLILDEPTIGLDVVSRLALRDHLHQLSLRGDIAIVLTTHDLGEIEQLCQRVVVIDHGHVIHDGSLRELFARHGHRREAVVTLERPVDRLPDLDPRWDVRIGEHGKQVTLGLPGTGTDLTAALAVIGRLGPIADLRLSEPGIDAVVAALYRGSR